jgi:membrane fusion protein (multidrug efflux system)
MMTIVPLGSQNIWVTANSKETQLRHMRTGQRAKISVDTYGRTYNGRVLNIAGATGSLFRILPPENATGNYTKVVQRIPVKIVFDKGQDPDHLLRLGMSVEPKVNLR